MSEHHFSNPKKVTEQLPTNKWDEAELGRTRKLVDENQIIYEIIRAGVVFPRDSDYWPTDTTPDTPNSPSD